jgi:tetratricopeptide (TPR) repeat protein
MRSVLKIWVNLFLISTILLSGLIYTFYFQDLKAFWLTREGVKFIQSEEFGTAFEKMSEALQVGSASSVHHLNLGLTQELLKREEDAIKSYTFSEKNAQDSQIQFYSWFNLGRIEAQRKNVKVALEHYQRALEIDPNSEPVKINIELLVNQQQQEQQQKQDQKKQDSSSKNQNGQDGNEQDSPNEKDKPQKSNSYSSPQKQNKKFESPDLQEADVKKILGELERQEQKIRREYNKQTIKERGNAKDW